MCCGNTIKKTCKQLQMTVKIASYGMKTKPRKCGMTDPHHWILQIYRLILVWYSLSQIPTLILHTHFSVIISPTDPQDEPAIFNEWDMSDWLSYLPGLVLIHSTIAFITWTVSDTTIFGLFFCNSFCFFLTFFFVTALVSPTTISGHYHE